MCKNTGQLILKMSLLDKIKISFSFRDAIQRLALGQIKKYVCFRFPDRPYFFLPTLRLFIVSEYQIIRIWKWTVISSF